MLNHVQDELIIDLTYSWALHQECDDTEEVHICIINSELNKYCPRVHIQPFIYEKILKCAVDEEHNICSEEMYIPHTYEGTAATVRQFVVEHTDWHFQNPGRDPPRSPLPCRAPVCPRKVES